MRKKLITVTAVMGALVLTGCGETRRKNSVEYVRDVNRACGQVGIRNVAEDWDKWRVRCRNGRLVIVSRYEVIR